MIENLISSGFQSAIENQRSTIPPSAFQVLPQMSLRLLRQTRVVKDIAQLHGREASGEFQGAGQRRVRVAQQGKANLGAQRPFRVMADGFDESGAGAGMLQRPEDGGFGEARTIQCSLPDG